ncbi:MAG: sigma 54-interacting transcriptional regulator [Nitrospinae bacterium]|nr:sigma 54-interacting transcriptional regulator [Nitrospinota bacterium]
MDEQTPKSAPKAPLDAAFLGNILDGIRDSIKILGRDFTVLFVNKSGLNSGGKELDKDALIGARCFEGFHGSQELCSYCVVKQVFDTGQPAFNTFTTQTGAQSSLKEVSVYPLTSASGSLDSVIEIVRDVTDLRRGMYPSEEFSDIISLDPKMMEVFRLMQSVAPTNSTVLIHGETGTGKELAARAIHRASKRAGKKFVAINCGALTDSLLETELFGHEKGSFTGAIARKIGKFELADKGTLFLDEIGNISQNMQVKILRALQEGEITRVGGNENIKVDVRYVCATNVDLREAVRKGEFREDLYYRINVVPVSLPPLRERQVDIQPIAEHYLRNFNEILGRNLMGFTSTAIDQMRSYFWPGNIRELKNLVERAAIMSKGPYVERLDIPAVSSGQTGAEGTGAMELKNVVARAEREYLVEILRRFNGNVTEASKHAGVNARTIHRKIKELGIDRE